MPPKECLTRLRRELQAIILDPPQHIQVSVNESDMLEWHYLIEGPKDTPYVGGSNSFFLKSRMLSFDIILAGWYHGKLRYG